MELMVVGVDRLQSASTVADAYGQLLAELVGMLHQRVGGCKLQPPLLKAQLDGDVAVVHVGGAILEGILHEGQEDHRRDDGGVIVHFAFPHHRGMAVQPDTLQIDVVADVVGLVAYADPVVAGRHIAIPQQLGKLDEGLFGLIRGTDDQAVEGVERVEQEVGRYLSLEEGQLGSVTLALGDALQQPAVVEFLDESHAYRVSHHYGPHKPQADSDVVVAHARLVFAHRGQQEIHLGQRVAGQEIGDYHHQHGDDGQLSVPPVEDELRKLDLFLQS